MTLADYNGTTSLTSNQMIPTLPYTQNTDVTNYTSAVNSTPFMQQLQTQVNASLPNIQTPNVNPNSIANPAYVKNNYIDNPSTFNSLKTFANDSFGTNFDTLGKVKVDGIMDIPATATPMERLAIENYNQNLRTNASQSGGMMQGVAQGVGALSSLASIFTGFEQLDLMKDQVGIAKEQWAETKAELTRVKGVRDKLTKSYMA